MSLHNGVFSPPSLPPSLHFSSLSLARFAIRMKLQKECGEAMHSIAMINIRLQSCLNLEHRVQGPDDNSQKLKVVSIVTDQSAAV